MNIKLYFIVTFKGILIKIFHFKINFNEIAIKLEKNKKVLTKYWKNIKIVLNKVLKKVPKKVFI